MTTAKRGIILAAGRGSRLRPITDETPKPLVPVNGLRMIDTSIRALHANGITEIYVVVGYLKDKFLPLEKEYPGLHLVENPWWDTCDNISSLYVVRDHLSESIIMEGDQVITDPSIIMPSYEYSGYNCVWMENGVDEWLYYEKDGFMTGYEVVSHDKGWEGYGISRWTAEDGERLKRHLEIQFEKEKNTHLFWDMLPLAYYPKEYRLAIFPMPAGVLTEIDSVDKLASVDPSYKPLADSLHNKNGE